MARKEKGASLHIQSLEKRYDSNLVLKGIDLSVGSGEFIAVVGKSGCGKSTLLRHIAGLEEPSNGDILYNGQRLKGLNPSTRFMFQEARLLPWQNILANVGVGFQLVGNWKEEAGKLLNEVGLSERGLEWPSVLSGGQKQRVALARALAGGPSLLLFDEPLGALDALTRLEMQRLIESLWLENQFTAVLVTHDVSEAVALADRVIVIDNGIIVLDRKVELPRPRIQTTAAFVDIQEEVLNQLLGEPTTVVKDVLVL
ncbi:ATP-binding cassette domain-containing protein [Bacillus sp. JCM 19041]|uniref:ATP-binding cassette domain-containing protein n=1 Tax=Bacillus sp. JCM 19041 TaxID=1460637 RepID=UPI0006D10C39